MYGADAVGGVVNFVLKDDFEGASVDVRFGDTEHGGNQEITISGLIGANMAGDRGNVMLGVERATRSEQRVWERDWRLDGLREPEHAGLRPSSGAARRGSGTRPEYPDHSWSIPVSRTPITTRISRSAGGAATSRRFSYRTIPRRTGRSSLPGCLARRLDRSDPVGDRDDRRRHFQRGTRFRAMGTLWRNIDSANFRLNDDGTLYTGPVSFQDGAIGTRARYRFNGPLYHEARAPAAIIRAASRACRSSSRAPNGYIKENNLYQWASSPLERLSAFANGHFDVSDSVRVTAQAYAHAHGDRVEPRRDGRQHQPVGRGRPFRQRALPRQQHAAVSR